MNKFIEILEKCSEYDIDYYILSNSPYGWIEYILSKSNLKYYFNEMNIYSALHKSDLKP